MGNLRFGSRWQLHSRLGRCSLLPDHPGLAIRLPHAHHDGTCIPPTGACCHDVYRFLTLIVHEGAY